jgi:hypothetical protein
MLPGVIGGLSFDIQDSIKLSCQKIFSLLPMIGMQQKFHNETMDGQ